MKDRDVDMSILIEQIGGFCPVQADGTIDGKRFYFRARGNRWTLSIGGSDPVIDPEWHFEEPYGEEPFIAGYMEIAEAEAFIAKAADLWRAGAAPSARGSGLRKDDGISPSPD
jgi:hypothetical protein